MRKFDWEAAQELHAKGVSYEDLGKIFGVTSGAVRLACDPKARKETTEASRRHQTSGVCDMCGKPCSKNRSQRDYERCHHCASLLRATTVRPDTLWCVTCKKWLPDEKFYRVKGHMARRGRKRQCIPCANRERQRRRLAARVPCEAGCGTLTSPEGRRKPGQPILCQRCANIASHERRRRK